MQLFFWKEPLPVQIIATDAAPVVAANHAVRVQTGCKHERVVLSEGASLGREQVFVDTLEHETARSFTGVHARSYGNDRFLAE